MRLNARLEKEFEPKLKFLIKSTGLNVTDVVKKSVTIFYDQVRNQKLSPLSLLKEEGFIACGQGPADLSKNYKAELTQSLNKKMERV